MNLQYSENNVQIYNNGQLQQEFDISDILKKISCTTPDNKIKIDNNLLIENETSQTLIIENHDTEDYQIKVNQESDTIESIQTRVDTSDYQILRGNSSITLNLYQKCTETSKKNPDYAWGFIFVNVSMKNDKLKTTELPFQFTYTCNKQYFNVTFDWSLVILILLSILLMTFLTKFSRIHSFSIRTNKGRFQGKQIDICVTFIYFFLYSVGFFFVFYSKNVEALGWIIKIFTYILGFFCSLFIVDEGLSLSPEGSFWKNKIFWRIRVCEIFSFILASGFMTFYLFTQVWYISDMISIFIMSTMVKFFKFKSLKYAYLFLITCVLLDSTSAIVILYTTDQSYNSLTLKKLNCPIELQLPLINLQYDRSCAWISLFSIAIPGLFFGFTYRYGKNKRTYAYTFFSMISLLLGYILWITTTIVQSYSFPSSVFIYPLILISTTIIAFKRNELQSIWNANFYDEFLEKTHRLSNNNQDNNHKQNIVNLLEGLDNCPEDYASISKPSSKILKS